MKTLLGNDYTLFLESLSQSAPVSIRLNPFKPISHFDSCEEIPWTKDGRYLKQRPSFTFDPLFQAGCYYVQEASSMFIEKYLEEVFSKNGPVKILDLCAAPGGKSTHIISEMPAGSILFSNEMIPKRNSILRQNIVKWGHANVIVTQNKPGDFDFLQDYFDLVLVDAPCSGEGLFRRDPFAAAEWNPAAVEQCAWRQKEILQLAAGCVKPGGSLIYSTCTFESSENEEQVKWLMDEHKLEPWFPRDIPAGIVRSDIGLRFYPHKVRGEGFFVSALRKAMNAEASWMVSGKKNKSRMQTRNGAASPYLKGFLTFPEKFTEIQKDDRVYALPNEIVDAYLHIESKLFTRLAGICMGKVSGLELIPAHDLSLSMNIRKDLPSISLTHDDSIRYLRCETVHHGNHGTGWFLANFKGHNLGWMKVMEGRTNNYFPKEWRILKEMPTE